MLPQAQIDLPETSNQRYSLTLHACKINETPKNEGRYGMKRQKTSHKSSSCTPSAKAVSLYTSE